MRTAIPPTSSIQPAEMTERQFERISVLVKELCGINLHTGKKELVKARLGKRLRKLGIANFHEYLRLVEADQTGSELTNMLDALSTNLTSFFRENQHFDYLKDVVLARLQREVSKEGGAIRIWSAGCSTGEEPYSIAITLAETLNLAKWDLKILATDLSTDVLARAREGIYNGDRLQSIPPLSRSKYFTCFERRPEKRYRINEDVRRLVCFARLNLMEDWPMKGPFDAIFCRNVMIYFDKPTQAGLVERFWKLLGRNGVMFIGHSESLAGIKHRFHYVEPTIYEKR